MNPVDRNKQRPRQQGSPKAGRPPERGQVAERKKVHRPKYDPAEMLDLRLRLGLEDFEVRLPKEHYGVLVSEWELAGLDVILRAAHSSFETNIVLRGGQGGYISIKPCDPDKNLPVYNVISVMAMRRKALEEQGIE